MFLVQGFRSFLTFLLRQVKIITEIFFKNKRTIKSFDLLLLYRAHTKAWPYLGPVPGALQTPQQH